MPGPDAGGAYVTACVTAYVTAGYAVGAAGYAHGCAWWAEPYAAGYAAGYAFGCRASYAGGARRAVCGALGGGGTPGDGASGRGCGYGYGCGGDCAAGRLPERGSCAARPARAGVAVPDRRRAVPAGRRRRHALVAADDGRRPAARGTRRTPLPPRPAPSLRSSMSPYAVPLLSTLGGAAFAFLLGRFLGSGRVTSDGELGGQALSLIGAVLLSSFILLTGFQVAGSWSALSSARSGTYDEARALTDTYWAAGGLAAADRTAVRGLLRQYTDEVRTAEFPELAHGRTSAAAWQALDRLRGAVRGAVAAKPEQQASKAAAQAALATVYETRSDRAAAVKAGIPRVIWLAMVASGAFLIAFPAVLGLTATARHLVAVSFAGAAVAFAIVLAAQLNHPFREPFGVSRAAFVFAETRFGEIDSMRAPSPSGRLPTPPVGARRAVPRARGWVPLAVALRLPPVGAERAVPRAPR